MSKEDEEIVLDAESDELEGSNEIIIATAENKYSVEEARKGGLLPPIDEKVKDEIRIEARKYIKEISNMSPNSPEYEEKIKTVRTLAFGDTIRATNSNNRMLDRASSSVNGARKSGNEGSLQVSSALNELRTKIIELDPNGGQQGFRKFLSILPGGKKLVERAQYGDTAKQQLTAIIDSVDSARELLIQDNEDLNAAKREQWETVLQLDIALEKISAIDEELDIEIQERTANGQIELATAFKGDLQFAIRQRQQSIMSQMVVAGQSFMAMGLLQNTNIQYIDAIQDTKNITVPALEVAVVIASGLDAQDKAGDTIDLVNKTTESLMRSNSQRIGKNMERSFEKAASSGVSVEVLKESLERILSAGRSIDAVRARENDKMKVSVAKLREVFDEAKPYMERMNAIDNADGGDFKALGSAF